MKWLYSFRRWTLEANARVTLRGERLSCKVYIDEDCRFRGMHLDTAKQVGERLYREELATTR
jgi:hypothetical protein